MLPDLMSLPQGSRKDRFCFSGTRNCRNDFSEAKQEDASSEHKMTILVHFVIVKLKLVRVRWQELR